MTPPLSGPTLGGTAKLPPLPDAKAPQEIATQPAVLNPSDSSYVKLDDASDTYANVEDLLKAIGDAQLFGSVANAKYQPERNKKYLKVTLAILEVRKYLKGDEKNAATAPQKIEDWLNDADLLGDTVVAHQARVNLIKALKRAPKGAGIDEGVKAMLASLSKNYTPKAEPPKKDEAAPAEKPKDLSAFLADLSDQKLFGEKFSSYDAKRNKAYLAVTVAIMEIKKFARGDASDAEAAKTKVAAWLNDYDLLTGEVPHQARVNLIKALETAPKQGEAWNQGIQLILETLKAKYSPAKPEKPAEPDAPKDAPKDKPKEDPKPVEKPKDEAPKDDKPKDPPAEKPKEVEKPKEEAKPKALLAKYVFTKFTYGIKEKREDTDMTLVKTVMATLRPAVDPLIAKDPEYSLQAEMQVKINNDTGEVVEIVFEALKVQGKIGVDETESALQNMAERFHARYRFVRGKDDKGPFTIIEIPLNIKKK